LIVFVWEKEQSVLLIWWILLWQGWNNFLTSKYHDKYQKCFLDKLGHYSEDQKKIEIEWKISTSLTKGSKNDELK
jgi:hypothetical protein